MTWRVDPPQRIGTLAVAAIVEVEVQVTFAGPLLAGMAEKRPLLVLLVRDGVAFGVDIKGHFYEATEIDYLYPEAIPQVLALMRDAQSDARQT